MDEARRASSIFPDGMLVPHEKPDFLLCTGRETIGIEVTELCREEPRAEGRRLAKVPDETRSCYSRLASAEPVDVGVGFSLLAKNIKSKKLTKSLVEFVHKNQNNKGVGFTKNLPKGYCHIGIHAPLVPIGRWHGAGASDTVVAPKELLESRIAEKNSRVQNYRISTPGITQVWLLIVNDQFIGPGEVYADSIHLAEWKFVFDFEKVLLFSRVPGGGGKVIELLRVTARV